MSKKIDYFCYLNAMAAIAVVFIHANGYYWYFRDDVTWVINNCINSLCVFAVPTFFMLTGATLLDYRDRYDTKTFFIKRIQKAVIPFFAWSILLVLRRLLFSEYNTMSFEEIFNSIFDTKILEVYWFFKPLFCIYLSIPLLSAVKKEYKIKVFSFTAIAGFLINIFIPFSIGLINNLFSLKLAWSFHLDIVNEYLIYVLLGYVLKNLDIKFKHRIVIYICSLLSIGIHIVGTSAFAIANKNINSVFWGKSDIFIMLYSVGIFVFIKYAVEKRAGEKITRFMRFLNKYTFEIYLMHMIVFVPLAVGLAKIGIPYESIPFVFIMPLINIPICILITFVMRKIPIVKRIVP